MYACTKFQLIWRTSDYRTKFTQKNMNGKNFEKMNIKIVITCSNVPLYQVSVNLKNFKFWHQIFRKKI